MTTPNDLAERHDLKVWQMFYNALADGRKTFEVRRDDRGFKVGDTLRLREWDNYGEGGYTGRECERRITYILSGDQVVDFGVQRGFVVLGLAALDSASSEAVTDERVRELAGFVATELAAQLVVKSKADGKRLAELERLEKRVEWMLRASVALDDGDCPEGIKENAIRMCEELLDDSFGGTNALADIPGGKEA